MVVQKGILKKAMLNSIGYNRYKTALMIQAWHHISLLFYRDRARCPVSSTAIIFDPFDPCLVPSQGPSTRSRN